MAHTLDLVREMRSSITNKDFEMKKISFTVYKKVLSSLIQVSDLYEVFRDPGDAPQTEKSYMNVHAVFADVLSILMPKIEA